MVKGIKVDKRVETGDKKGRKKEKRERRSREKGHKQFKVKETSTSIYVINW